MIIESVYEESRTKKHKRELILNTAYHMFVEQGIESVTMMELAKACDIQRRTLYNYYSTKEEVADDIMACWHKNASALGIPEDMEFKNAYEKAVFLGNQMYDYVIEHAEAFVFSYHYDHYFQKNHVNRFKDWLLHVIPETLLQEGVQDGSINPKYSGDTALYTYLISKGLITIIQKVLYRQNIGMETKKLLIRNYIDFFVGAIKA